MSSVALFVGLDYHQKRVQVCILDADGNVLLNRKVKNRMAVIGKLLTFTGIGHLTPMLG